MATFRCARLVLPGLSIGLSLAACEPWPTTPTEAQAPAPYVPTSADTMPTRAPSVHTSSPATTAVPSASSATPAAVPSATATASPAAHLPKVSTSPGKIECATVECDLKTEICCQEDRDSGRCVARSTHTGCGSLNVLAKECDESADCATGESCCYTPRPDEYSSARNVCKKGGCSDPDLEACLAGGKCRDGQECQLLPKSMTTQEQYDGWCPRHR